MNLEDLRRLQKSAKDLSVFFIEKDKNGKKQIDKLLEKSFKNVFYSLDEDFALKRISASNADLLIVSLPLKQKNIVEFMTLLNEHKTDLKIIVATFKNDDYEFLRNFDMGIEAIVLKPYDLDPFIDTLTNVLSDLKPKNFQENEKFSLNIQNDIKVSLFYKNEQINCKVLNISQERLYLYILESSKQPQVLEKVDLTLGFEVLKAFSGAKEGVFVKAFAKGEIVKIAPYLYGWRVEISFSLRKSDQSNFDKYLKSKEFLIK